MKSLAERPADRSLRLILADWWQEQGDARGEALALASKVKRSPTEQRRLDRLQRDNRERWLGSLGEHATEAGWVVEDGLLREVTLKGDLPATAWEQLANEPRFWSVTRLRLTPGRGDIEPEPLLLQPCLQGLTMLGADAVCLRRLRAAKLPFALREVEVATREAGSAIDDELLAASSFAPEAPMLSLTTDDFLNPELVAMLADGVGRSSARGFYALKVQYGTLEGAAQWLLSGADQPNGQWSVRINETLVTLRSSLVEVDLRGPGERFDLAGRVATAASILALLDPLQPTLVEVLRREGEAVGQRQLDALKAAQRRLPTVTELRVAAVS